MGQKRQAPKAAPEAEPQDVAEERVTHDPDVYVCVDGTYIEHPDAASRPFRLNIDGQNVEHVSDDVDGVWVYRAM